MRFLLVLSLLTLLSLSGVSQTNQLLTFDAELIDIGEVKKGDFVSGVFNFTNTSEEIVTIDLVSTCECTDANWPEDEIAPGATGKIEFVFDTSKKDEEEPIDIDVILKNNNKEGIPYFHYLSYNFKFSEN